MKIVILRINTSDFGKVGTYNVQEIGLANALIRKGHDVDVLYLNKKTNKIITDDKYNYVYYLPHKAIGLHGIFNVKMLNKFAPDKVILFSDNQLWAKNVIMWCKKNNLPCIQYMGAVLSDNPGWLHQFYTKLILKRNIKSYSFSINVAKTTKVKKEMEKLKIPFKKVINVGLDKDLLHSSVSIDYKVRIDLGYDKENKILLFIGRIVDYKKPLLACHILEELRKRDPSFRLIIIGKGALHSQLTEYIEENNLNDYVNYIERVPYEEIYKYMVASDCLINLSSIEIFGMTILEAMYYQLAVIAHTAPGPNDIIDNNKTGILCNTDETKVWCDLVTEAIIKKEEYGEKARKAVEKFFLWDSIAEQFLN